MPPDSTHPLAFVPRDRPALLRFGAGDYKKTKRYILQLSAFLEEKPFHTKRTYRTAIQQFFDLFKWISPEEVTNTHAVAFKKWLLREGKSEATTYYRLSALRSFFDYLRHPDGASGEPLIKNNPFEFVNRSDIKPTPFGRSRAMEWETFKKILDAVPPTPVGMRDKAILLFLGFTGRRRAEVAHLRASDVDLKKMRYTCRVKGGKVMTWELPSVVADAIEAYWIAADRQPRGDDGVFSADVSCPLTKNRPPNRPVCDRLINEILRRAAIRAKVPLDDVHVHGLRHMVARDADKAGLRLQDIQAMLGHSSPNTTQVYLQRISGPIPSHSEALTKLRNYAAAAGRELSKS